MPFKAIFFDRDGTLVHNDESATDWRNKTISGWSGKPFVFNYEKMIHLFQRAEYFNNVHTVEDEIAFFRRYYRLMLTDEGVTEGVDARADLLFDNLWCKNYLPYRETVDVLEYFQRKGYRMGVISDTSPSLQLTLETCALARYFTSFTASSVVGAGKPDPRIFNAALHTQGVTAQESIFVDDTLEEAEGAGVLGFAAFWLDRSRKENDLSSKVIKDLRALVDFAKENQ